MGQLQKAKEISQGNIDIIKDPSLENEICLSEREYLFIDGPLIVRENTRIRIPEGTILRIKDK